MAKHTKWVLSDKDKAYYISELTAELPMLRAKADISQDELASVIGISRQTYGSLERHERTMTWNTYLSLILFYDKNSKTRNILRSMDAYPHKLINLLDNGTASAEVNPAVFGSDMADIFQSLDEQAIHAIKAMIMIEYARCTNQPGETVVKSFNGLRFSMESVKKENVAKAVRTVRRKRRFNG